MKMKSNSKSQRRVEKKQVLIFQPGDFIIFTPGLEMKNISPDLVLKVEFNGKITYSLPKLNN